MKLGMILISILLITGCKEKNIIQKELKNNEKEIIQKTNKESKFIHDSHNQINLETRVEENTKDNFVPNQNDQMIKEAPPILETPVHVEEEDMQEINQLEQEINTLLISEQLETIKEKVIDRFITLVDFIYYDAPIGNLYFKDLTSEAQLKVRNLMMRMDGAIENKFPNYKDFIKEKYQKALHYVKSKTNEILNKAGEKMEETIGSDNYQNFIDAKDDLKDSFQNTAELVKEGASKVYEQGKEKVSNWYQGLKEKYNK